jgi:hypothetical protein
MSKSRQQIGRRTITIRTTKRNSDGTVITTEEQAERMIYMQGQRERTKVNGEYRLLVDNTVTININELRKVSDTELISAMRASTPETVS